MVETLTTPAGATAATLEDRRARLRAAGAGELQKRSVRALAAIGSKLLGSDHAPVIGGLPCHGANEAAWMSLMATLGCWTEAGLWELIDEEGVRATSDGPSITLHIVAANMPLLAWSSVARALLVESASIVRLPSGAPDVAAWTELFVNELHRADAELAGLLEIVHWPSGDSERTRAYCRTAQAVLVYGSDATVKQVASLTAPEVRFLGYDDRLSFAVIAHGADLERAAAGTAVDIVLFDQQGCLSPQLVFVEEDPPVVSMFCGLLANHLRQLRHLVAHRGFADKAAIKEAAALARFDARVVLETAPDLQYTIIQHPSQLQSISQARGLVHVIGMTSWQRGILVLKELGLARKLQGASIASRAGESVSDTAHELLRNGVFYLCEPGRLQMPPFGWRENGLRTLQSLTQRRA